MSNIQRVSSELLINRDEWHDVLGYEGLYAINAKGDVMALTASYQNQRKAGRIVKASVTSKGYAKISLFKDTARKCIYVHKLVMEAFHGIKPEGMQVNHKNGDRQDNRVENLEYVTAIENTQHAIHVLKHPRQTKRWVKPLLSRSQVREVRAQFALGISRATISSRFGITRDHISKIVNGSAWKDTYIDDVEYIKGLAS